MSLRLILFIIALLVIAWIIWDHKRKNTKKNYYVDKKRTDASLLFVTNPKRMAYDIDNEVMSEKGAAVTKANNITQSFNHTELELEDEDIDMEFPINEDKNYYKPDHQSRDNFDDEDDEDDEDPFANLPIKQSNNAEEDEYDNSNERKINTPNLNTNNINNSGSAVKTQPKNLEEPLKQVFTIYIKSKSSTGFKGDELLHALLSVGCRFGEMNIFHRHEKTSGQGQVMFSVASMVNPGTFDINKMQDTTVPGLVLFFTYPGTSSPLLVYDLMLKTSFKLAKYLEADILDEDRALLTPAKTKETRDKIELLEVNEFF